MKLTTEEALKILQALRESKKVLGIVYDGSCLVSVLESLKIFENHGKKKK